MYNRRHCTTSWIEGMGDVEQLFWSEFYCGQYDAGSSDLFCFSTNGELLYIREGLNDCFTTSTESIDKTYLSVYPNPASDVLYVQNENGEHIERIMIYNTTGILIINTTNPTSQNQLDISAYPSGFYQGIVFFKNNTMRQFKFV